MASSSQTLRERDYQHCRGKTRGFVEELTLGLQEGQHCRGRSEGVPVGDAPP